MPKIQKKRSKESPVVFARVAAKTKAAISAFRAKQSMAVNESAAVRELIERALKVEGLL